MSEKQSQNYDEVQTGALSADIFFYGDEKPLNYTVKPESIESIKLTEFPKHLAKVTHITELDGFDNDSSVAKYYSPANRVIQALNTSFSHPASNVIEYPHKYTTTPSSKFFNPQK